MDLVLQALFLFGATVLALALLVGAGLVVWPEKMRQLSARLDRWHSLRVMLGPLDRQHLVERRIYRYHRIAGLLITVGAGYTLLMLFTIAPSATGALLPASIDPGLRDLLATAVYGFLLVSNAGALGVGLLVYFRPSALKSAETAGNRWLSTRRVTKPLDVIHNGLDTTLWRHPRLIGAFILAGVLYVIGVFAAYHFGIFH